MGKVLTKQKKYNENLSSENHKKSSFKIIIHDPSKQKKMLLGKCVKK